MTSVANILVNTELKESLNQKFDLIGNSINVNELRSYNRDSLVTLSSDAIIPALNNSIDLGSESKIFRNIYGNVNGEQPNITALPMLVSIQNQSISSGSWAHVNGMDQDVKIGSDVSFDTLISTGNNASQFKVSNVSAATIVNVDTITPAVTINSDMTVNGNITYNSITNLTTVDPMIKLADGNLTNTLDIGFYGQYSDDGKTPLYGGLYRDHTDSKYKFYNNLATEPGVTVGTAYDMAKLNSSNYEAKNGSLANASFGFIDETNTGMYKSAANNIDFAIAGSGIVKINAAGLITTGDTKSTTFTIGATSINGTTWGFLNSVNQSLGTSNTPSFSTVTATTFNGALNGNSLTSTSATTAATLTNASQSAITTLDSLVSVATKSINGTQWTYLSNSDQNFNMAASPTFVTVTANLNGLVTTAAQSNITSVGTLTGLTVAGDITQSSGIISIPSGTAGAPSIVFGAQTTTGIYQPTTQTVGVSVFGVNVLTVQNTGLTMGAGKTITGLLATTNQSNITALGTLASLTMGGAINLATNNITNGGTITATSFVGALTGNASTSTTAATVTTAAQPAITSVGTLTGLTVSGVTALAGGSVTTPSLHFGDSTTGFYKAGTNALATAVNGTTRLFVNSGGGLTVGTSDVAAAVNARLCVTNTVADAWAMYIDGNSTTGSATTSLSFRDNGSSRQYSIGCRPSSLFAISDETGGARRMVVNSSGNVTLGGSDLASTNYKLYNDGNAFIAGTLVQQDRCIIKMLAGTITYPSGGFEVICFENSVTVVTDPLSWFNPSGSAGDVSRQRIVVSKAGTYLVKASIRLADAASGTSIGIAIRKNAVSTNFAHFFSPDNSGRRTAVISDSFVCAASDYLSVYVFHTSTVNSVECAYFEVERIGA